MTLAVQGTRIAGVGRPQGLGLAIATRLAPVGAAFLCSPKAAYITAGAINVSGGKEYH